MPEIRGSCLCGGVKYAINGPILGPAKWQDDDPGLPQFAQMPGETGGR